MRHLILKICTCGKYLQEHKLAGANPMKKEIRLLTSHISFATQVLDVGPMKYSRDDVTYAIKGMTD